MGTRAYGIWYGITRETQHTSGRISTRFFSTTRGVRALAVQTPERRVFGKYLGDIFFAKSPFSFVCAL